MCLADLIIKAILSYHAGIYTTVAIAMVHIWWLILFVVQK